MKEREVRQAECEETAFVGQKVTTIKTTKVQQKTTCSRDQMSRFIINKTPQLNLQETGSIDLAEENAVTFSIYRLLKSRRSIFVYAHESSNKNPL